MSPDGERAAAEGLARAVVPGVLDHQPHVAAARKVDGCLDVGDGADVDHV